MKGKSYGIRYKHHFKTRTKIKKYKQDSFKDFFKKLTLFCLIAGVLAFVSKMGYKYIYLSDSFKIKSIDITGLKTIREGEFRNFMALKPGDNLISTYFSGIEKNLMARYIQIKKIEVNRNFPGSVNLSITEREPVAWIKLNNSVHFVDSDNISFKMNRSTSSVPQIFSEGLSPRIDALNLLLDIRKKKAELYSRIIKLYNEKGRFVFFLNDNSKIVWGLYNKTSFGTKFEYLVNALSYAMEKFKAIDYINLELFNEGRIVVKPKTIEFERKKVKGGGRG